jgi:hypothetical protein
MCNKKDKLNESCPIKKATDCKYKSKDVCPYDTTKCLIPSDTEDMEKPKGIDIALGLIFISAIFMIASIIIPQLKISFFGHREWDVIFEIIFTLSTSLFTGSFLAKLINIPQYMEDYTTLISTALTSSKYLKALSKDQLKKLRGRVTHRLHIRNVPNMPIGLIDLDEKICEHLEKPYYSKYNEIIHCLETGLYSNLRLNKDVNKDEIGETKVQYIKKQVVQEYTLNNPYDEKTPVKADIGLNNHLNLDDDCSIEGIFQIDSFKISIDNAQTRDIKSLLQIWHHKHTKASDLDPAFETYDTGIYLSSVDDVIISNEYLEGKAKSGHNFSAKSPNPQRIPDGQSEYKLFVKFNKCVKVTFVSTKLIPIVDRHYTKRLKYAAESYSLIYTCDDDNVKLVGQLFGTLVDHSNMSIRVSPNEKVLTIETSDWLLPRNGAVVVMCNKT